MGIQMESRSLQNELDTLRREKITFQAQNKLFENLIEMVRSSSKVALLKATMQKTLDVACELSGAEKGSLFLMNESGVVTDSILTRGEVPSEERLSLIGRVLDQGLAGWVREHHEIGLVQDTRTDARWLSLPDEPYLVRSALAVPILRHSWLYGILTLMHGRPDHFSRESIVIMQTTADHMALAIENAQLYMKLDASYRSLENAKQSIERYSKALDNELEKGRKIQRDFLPRKLPDVLNCEIAAYFHPALQLSGDFYDVFALPGNLAGLVIADVSGKGVGSALFMALLRSLIRIYSGHAGSHHVIDDHNPQRDAPLSDPVNFKDVNRSNALAAISLTNEYIVNEHGEEGMFATMFFGIIDPSSGLLTYINAGHEPVLILAEDGIRSRLKPTGPAIGLIKGTHYNINKIQLHPGNMLLGYTDGVTEARSPDDELYTRKRLETLLADAPTKTAADAVDRIKSRLLRFTVGMPQSDDITMLALRWK